MDTTVASKPEAYPYRVFGLLIKDARKKRGITQLILSNDSSVPLKMIQEYEQGRCFPSGQRLLRIIATLKPDVKTLDEIVRYQEEMIMP